MARVSVFNSPFLVSFDHFERALDRVTKAQGDRSPPYNIEKISADSPLVILAVAGFAMDQLSVEVENNQMIIRGKQEDDTARVYLYRGIAARQFIHTFVLAEGIRIDGAALDNGLLHIDLSRPVPEKRVHTVEIKAGR